MQTIRESLYIVDFQEIINDFQKVIAHEAFPTIDVGVAVWQVFSAFENIPANVSPLDRLETVCNGIAYSDHLIEHTAWDTWEEDVFVRDALYNALYRMGKAMYDQLKLYGIMSFYNNRCTIKQPITDETFILKRAAFT